MKKYKMTVRVKQILADTITPVSIYLKIRDFSPYSVLLEASDYRGNENSYSFICLKQLAHIEVKNSVITESFPDNTIVKNKVTSPDSFKDRFASFIGSFKVDTSGSPLPSTSGLYGYMSYDAIQLFESIKLKTTNNKEYAIPDVYYAFYKYIIAVNHHKNQLTIIEHLQDGEKSDISTLETLLYNRNISSFNFKAVGKEKSNITDKEYMNMVTKGKEHCYRGDVFQVVMSRQYSQSFKGDDFNVYRALRSINPSPYLFYFDYGSFRIFGSSPEAQVKVIKGRAIINPIAGTFRRTGNDEEDKKLAEELAADIKENAEHVMLVDLARNDLSIRANNVRVDSYREIQFYSHVIHMVSTVSGELKDKSNVADVLTSTFPAGTLSGAPKYKAMELIDKYENQLRGYYGGAIGMIGLDGTLNHAIMIRSFLSKNNKLFYQAGAGIVSVSNEKSELNEVNNKLGALKKAIIMAQEV